jgi:hypothetical protein
MWSRVPEECLTPRQTGRMTVGRNITLNLTFDSGGGSNTSTVVLRVVRGDKNGTQCPEGIIGPPCSWGHKYGDLALQVGEVSNLKKKYDRESRRTGTLE